MSNGVEAAERAEADGEGAAAPIEPASGRDYVLLVVISVLSAAADLATKAWATARLGGFEPGVRSHKQVEVVPGLLDFIFTLNPGGAWSFLRGLPEYYRRPFFLFVSAAAMVFMVALYARLGHRFPGMRWGLPLALGGAFGNLVDRIRYGSVIDFIDVYVRRGGREHHWPTFNVADVAIVIGVLLMAFEMLFAGRHEEPSARAKPPAESPPDAPGGAEPPAEPPSAGLPGSGHAGPASGA